MGSTSTDLPGSYSLSGNSDEEIITENYIRSKQADLVCVLVDASQLERSMYMLADFAALDTPGILLLNMINVIPNKPELFSAKALKKEAQ